MKKVCVGPMIIWFSDSRCCRILKAMIRNKRGRAAIHTSHMVLMTNDGWAAKLGAAREGIAAVGANFDDHQARELSR